MFITGKNLRLYYWLSTRTGYGPANIPEIEKEEYGYELQPGQNIYTIRYENVNREVYFYCKILDVNEEGILISSIIPETINKFVPWVKKFPIPFPNGEVKECDLYIEPCEQLFEKNKLNDILTGNIDAETIKDNKIIDQMGRGIWHKHGGRRTISAYEENLKNFSKNGQQLLI